MQLSPINFKRVHAMSPIHYKTALSEAYCKAGNLPENVQASANTIKVNYPKTSSSTLSEFDDNGNMKSHTIYENDYEDKKYIYYPGIGRATTAIDYNSRHKIKEVSIYNRHGEETENFNYDKGKATINGKEYTLSADGRWGEKRGSAFYLLC